MLRNIFFSLKQTGHEDVASSSEGKNNHLRYYIHYILIFKFINISKNIYVQGIL